MTDNSVSPSEDRYLQILDRAPDAMLIVDPNGKITFVNRQTEKLFGYVRADLVGMSLDVLIPERFRPTHGQHMYRETESERIVGA